MSSSMVDYFQLCDDLSESEDSPTSSERKDQEELKIVGKKISCQKQESVSEAESTATGQGFDTDAEMARSFVLSGWADVEDLDTFISLLDRRTVPSKQKMSAAESMAFIDSKLQYMREMSSETPVPPQIEAPAQEREKVVPVHGQPIEGGMDGSLLLDCLLNQLGDMAVHSLAFNLQLANVLCSLAAYPQPLLVATIFNTNANDQIPDLLKVLTKLKRRVDTAAAGIEGLDVYVRRCPNPHEKTPSLRLPPYYAVVRLATPDDDRTGYAVESEAAARDDAATKNIVHAAIVLANLCQFLAGIALQQSVVVTSNTIR
ncbi:unnamed protein product [Nippostrongylus brasiliensis]|uniref:UPF0518 protein (inferred by orthology to a C. elegans protein) n=1 Tax=Nippostrongylus brasiliensis TaxID=27835 RepID=A0A0N4YR75_NIPBR|nr:unnamed protein product [Nippostrongylus brasiliensis]